MADWSFARASLTAPKSRQRVRLLATLTVTGVRRNPWNLEDRWGSYHTCWCQDGSVWVRFAPVATPPFEFSEEVVIAGDAAEARLAIDPRGVLHLLYSRTGTGNVYAARSYDSGRTFEDQGVAFSGAAFPTISVGIDGTVIRAAVQGGKIVANLQAPGDAAPGSDFFFEDDSGADLLVAEDCFHLAEGREAPGRYLLHVLIDGESATSDWWSSDGGRSWTRFV